MLRPCLGNVAVMIFECCNHILCVFQVRNIKHFSQNIICCNRQFDLLPYVIWDVALRILDFSRSRSQFLLFQKLVSIVCLSVVVAIALSFKANWFSVCYNELFWMLQ
jgi:hypothetical protein